jgi:predicted HTH transcriptional regulator
MLSVEEIEGRLALNHETRSFELKGPGSREDKPFLVKVVRACLGMANLRDGGHVVIGIDDKNPASLGPGLSAADASTWRNHDHVSRSLAVYADPPIRFDVAPITLGSGALVVAIQVFEFDDYPHICVREFGDVLRLGAVYIRPRKSTETSQVASSLDMRDLLELATEKRLRSLLEMTARAGGTLHPAEATPSNAKRYDDQMDRGWS